RRNARRNCAVDQRILDSRLTDPCRIEKTCRISETIIPLLFHPIEIIRGAPQNRHVAAGSIYFATFVFTVRYLWRRETEFRQTNRNAKECNRDQRTNLEETGTTRMFDFHSSAESKSFLTQNRLHAGKNLSGRKLAICEIPTWENAN